MLEGVFLLSLILGFRLYALFSRPFDLLASGIETLKSQDFSMQLKPVRSKEFNLLVTVYNKMIDQLRKERIALSEKNFLLTLLMDASPSGIVLFNVDDELVNMNEAASRFIGHPLAILKGKRLKELSLMCNGMFDQALDQKNFVFKKGGTQSYRIQAGSFIDRGCDTRFILIEDISYEIFKTEKYAYEKVIRMMSHEVNNTVGAVNSILTSVQPKLAEWPNHQEAVEVCVQRNGHMNQFMGNFAEVVRIPLPNLQPINITESIQHAIFIVKNHVGDKVVDLVFNPDSNAIVVNADNGQLEQAFINILKNSLEAIEESGRIEIAINTDPIEVRISDNGVGIPDDLKGNMFTPFYTTKPNGQGIGLTVTREILINHQCHFSLESGGGITEFLIRFL